MKKLVVRCFCVFGCLAVYDRDCAWKSGVDSSVSLNSEHMAHEFAGGVIARGVLSRGGALLHNFFVPETQTFGQDMNLDNENTGTYNENNGGVANEQTDATGVVSVNHEGDRRNVYGQAFDVGGEGLSRALLSLGERNGRKAKAIRGKNGTNVIYTPAKVEEYSADVGVMVSYWEEHYIPYHVRKGEYLFERNGVIEVGSEQPAANTVDVAGCFVDAECKVEHPITLAAHEGVHYAFNIAPAKFRDRALNVYNSVNEDNLEAMYALYELNLTYLKKKGVTITEDGEWFYITPKGLLDKKVSEDDVKELQYVLAEEFCAYIGGNYFSDKNGFKARYAGWLNGIDSAVNLYEDMDKELVSRPIFSGTWGENEVRPQVKTEEDIRPETPDYEAEDIRQNIAELQFDAIEDRLEAEARERERAALSVLGFDS